MPGNGIAIIGAQFGDEGKGKVTDYYCEKADHVVRYNGGNNAGHTVVAEGETFKFNLLPSGIVRGKSCMIAAGVVVDPRVLSTELSRLEGKFDVQLMIDPRCHVIMPYHNLFDLVDEKKSGAKIGTTQRGIGPCYADKCDRIGIRFEDFIDSAIFKEKLNAIFPVKKKILEEVYGIDVQINEHDVFREYSVLAKKFAPMVGDVSLAVYEALKNNETVMFEAAQGTFLDNDFGTYPFVTSSHPLSGAVSTGVGLAPGNLKKIIGVAKAYCTRVGGGPFPTELTNLTGDQIRKKGNEFGTTTGRPRRVGWMDLNMMRTSCRLNGYTELAITKLDVLAGMDSLMVAESYTYKGEEILEFPSSLKVIEKCKPNYIEVEGFGSLEGVNNYKKLPKEARKYIELIESETETTVKMVSIGPEREQTLIK